MTTTLVFVDHDFVIDRKARRTIRSHVLKGKAAGRVRAPRRPPHAAKRLEHLGTSYASHDDVLPVYFSQKSTGAITQVGNSLSGLTSPCEMTAQSRRSVHDFLSYVGDGAHSPEFRGKPDPNLSLWFQYMLIDEAFFHCFIALSEACMDFVTGRTQQTSEYRHHMGAALRLINDKLSSANAVGDTNLAGVMTLCLLSSVRDQPLQTKIHFDGLCRMIEVRGGVDQLQSNPALIGKTHRIDIDLALQLGCPTKLGRSAKTLEAIVPIFSNPAFEVRSPLINAVRNADLEVFAAVKDIMKVSRLFNSGVAAKKLGARAFQDLITTTCYRLLEIKPIGGRRCDMHPIANAIHLALLSFMTTFLSQIGPQRRLRYDLLSRKLIKALDNPSFQSTVDPATHLWLLVMAGISVLSKHDHVWLKPRLAEAVEQFGFTDWQFSRRLLGKYPWVGELHDQPACQLWAACFPPVIYNE